MSYVGHLVILRYGASRPGTGRTDWPYAAAVGVGCQCRVGCLTAMARKTDTADPLAPLTLAVGQEDLLLDRAVQQVVAAARAADADTDVRDLTSDQLQPGTLAELTSPSLFAERKVVVVRNAQDLSADTIKDVKAYLARRSRRSPSSCCTRAGPRARGCSTPRARRGRVRSPAPR